MDAINFEYAEFYDTYVKVKSSKCMAITMNVNVAPHVSKWLLEHVLSRNRLIFDCPPVFHVTLEL